MSTVRGANGSIRVLICDDHSVFRRGLMIVLEGEPGIEVVGEAENGETAVELAGAEAPDIILMDVRMPGIGGIEATRRLAETVPSARIVMLTVSDEEADLYEAVKAGASGYLLKELSIEEVADAVRAVAAGQSLISPSMASKLLAEFSQLARRAEVGREGGAVVPHLTDRELEVLRLVARGMGNRAIGEALAISENTVKNHVRNMLEKLHLHSRTEAVMYAVRRNIIEVD